MMDPNTSSGQQEEQEEYPQNNFAVTAKLPTCGDILDCAELVWKLVSSR